MDVLTNKNRADKDYVSRYSSFPFYYHKADKKYIQGVSAQLDTDTSYVLVDINEATTLDFLANKYYGRPDYWWIIADFNHIQDPFMQIFPKFTTLKIPSIGNLKFKEDTVR